MKEFFHSFWTMFSKIDKREKRYYFCYTVVISAVYMAYILLPILYGRVVDQVMVGHPFGAYLVWYCLLIIAFMASFRLWSYGNVLVQRKVKVQLANRLFSALLANGAKNASAITIHLEEASKLFLDFVYTISPVRYVPLL